MPAVGAATFWMDGRPSVEPLRSRRMPLLLAATAFAAGIVLARSWHEAAVLALTILLLVLLAGAAVSRSAAVGWTAVLALWAAVGCWCAQVQAPVPQQTTLRSYADGLSRTVRGRVTAVRDLSARDTNNAAPGLATAPWQVEPGGWESEAGRAVTSVDLAVDAVEQVSPDVSTMVPVAGGVRVTLFGDEEPLHCGDIVELPVRLRVPEVYRDPGAFSYSDWLLGQGIGATASAKAAKARVISSGAGTPAVPDAGGAALGGDAVAGPAKRARDGEDAGRDSAYAGGRGNARGHAVRRPHGAWSRPARRL